MRRLGHPESGMQIREPIHLTHNPPGKPGRFDGRPISVGTLRSSEPMDRFEPPGTTPSDQVANRSEADPLRVLVVGVAWPMETFVARLITGLARLGLDLTIMSHGRPPTEWLEQRRVEWTFGPRPLSGREVGRQVRRNGLRSAIATTGTALRGRLDRPTPDAGSGRDRSFDVIYAPWINTLVEHDGPFATGIPVVTSCRGSLVTIAPWSPDRQQLRRSLPGAFKTARLVHCVSDAIVVDAVDLGLDAAKARVIRPAVDPSVFTPPTRGPTRAGPIRVIGVGTLDWRKDYEHALLALRHAVGLGADLRLDLIGSGPDRQHLLYAVHDLGLTDRVRLLGRRTPEQVAQALSDADVFLHTSCSEGISNAVLEAMATGLPVITTEAGGMREAVRHGVDGIVVGVRDAPATAAALHRLAKDPELRAQMGASARDRIVADFRLDQQVADFSDLLHEAAGR